MKKQHKAAPVLSLLALLASAVPTYSLAQQAKLKTIFTPEMLGANVFYLEQFTGPVWKQSGEKRTYKVEGCQVTAGTVGDEVKSLKINLTSKCTFDLNSFVLNLRDKLPTPNRMTFGVFDELTGRSGRYYSDCLTSCGNAADPFVWEHLQGSRADNSIEVLLEVVMAGDKVVDAANAWRSPMLEQYGQFWVEEGKFNCPRAPFNQLAQAAFKQIPITAITVGYGITPKLCP